MTVKELIDKLEEYDLNTEIKFDYGGHIEDIEEVNVFGDFIYIG